MARFDTTPPQAGLPRATDNLPVQARLPEGFELPTVDADPTANLPEDTGAPAGLPMIPVVNFSENFPEDLPDEAEDGLAHMPWA